MADFSVDDIDAEWLKKRYLWGVPLTDASGNAAPAELLDEQIAAAKASLELELDTKFSPTVVKTRPDAGLVKGTDYDEEGETLHYHRITSRIYGDVRLPVANVISVERVRGLYGNRPVWEFPLEWVIVRNREAFLNLVPNEGNIQGVLIGLAGAVGTVHLEFLRSDTLPGFWAIDYTYGMAPPFPAVLAE